MKIDARRIDAVISDPGRLRAVLFFGEDEGLVRELASRLVRSVAGSLTDPFLVVDVERDNLGSLRSEMASMSLMGGRKVVRLRDATDAATAAVLSALEIEGGGLLVLEGAGLTNKSKLKTASMPATRWTSRLCSRWCARRWRRIRFPLMRRW